MVENKDLKTNKDHSEKNAEKKVKEAEDEVNYENARKVFCFFLSFSKKFQTIFHVFFFFNVEYDLKQENDLKDAQKKLETAEKDLKEAQKKQEEAQTKLEDAIKNNHQTLIEFYKQLVNDNRAAVQRADEAVKRADEVAKFYRQPPKRIEEEIYKGFF